MWYFDIYMWVDNNISHKWIIREPGLLEHWTIREDLLYWKNGQQNSSMMCWLPYEIIYSNINHKRN